MAGYDPKRPRPSTDADLDALLGGPAPSGGDAVDTSRDTPGAGDEDSATSGPAAVETAGDVAAATPSTASVPTPEPVPSDPVPGAARHALPRRAEPLDQRVSMMLPLAPIAAGVVLALISRWWRRRR